MVVAVPDGLATFRTFLKSEYSDENIEFWLTCEDYKKIKSSFRMSSRAKKIYEQFIKAESPKEVNPRPPYTGTLPLPLQTHTCSVRKKINLCQSSQSVTWNPCNLLK